MSRVLHLLPAPDAPRELRLLCLLVRAGTGEARALPIHRINDQWRICFVWTDSGPADVEIIDYH